MCSLYGSLVSDLKEKLLLTWSSNASINMFECQKYISVFIRLSVNHYWLMKQKQKYRGMFETQKSRNKTSSGDIGLNIRTPASPKVGQDQVSGGVSVPCWHATPVAYTLWKPIFGKMSESVIMSSPGIMSESVIMSSPGIMSQTGIMSNRYRLSLVSTSRTNASPKRDRTRCPEE